MEPRQSAARGLAPSARGTAGHRGRENLGEAADAALAALPPKHRHVEPLAAVNGLPGQLTGCQVNYAINTMSS